jgi:chromosome partitioning protein
MQCEFYSLDGLSNLLNTIKLLKKNLNKNLSIAGILLTMYDKRNKLTEQVERDVRKYLGDVVFKTTIPRNVRVSEAPSHGLPVIIYDHRSPGAVAYVELAKEILKNGRLQCQ